VLKFAGDAAKRDPPLKGPTRFPKRRLRRIREEGHRLQFAVELQPGGDEALKLVEIIPSNAWSVRIQPKEEIPGNGERSAMACG